jgi:hypothetical protein
MILFPSIEKPVGCRRFDGNSFGFDLLWIILKKPHLCVTVMENVGFVFPDFFLASLSKTPDWKKCTQVIP